MARSSKVGRKVFIDGLSIRVAGDSEIAWRFVLPLRRLWKEYSQVQGRSSFFWLQAREPQTVAFGLTDSPVGWLAWMTMKFHDLVDHDGESD
jgi:hypothetical protein